MRPEWNWHGDSEREGGIATFECGDLKVTQELPSFRVASDIADLLYRAYREGASDGIGHAKHRVRQALDTVSERDL